MTYIVYKSQGMKKLLFHNLNSFKLICIQEMVFEKKIDYFDMYITVLIMTSFAVAWYMI